jgi:hypothetical protein
MVVFKMDNNIEKKVVELRRMNCMTSLYTMTRLRMRVIETKVVDLRRSKILTKNTMTRLRMRVIKKKVVDLRRGKILTKNNNIKVLARLGKALCLKAKGNDCGKRRGIEIRETGTRKRTRRVITNPTETTKKKTQQKRSINEERKRRKGRSSHQMVFDFTFYTDPV